MVEPAAGPAAGDEWVVVGGKGRPRRTAEQQAAHVAARQAAEATLAAMSPTYRRRQQHQQLLREAACSPPGAAAQQQPADGATAALPGWGPPPEREWRVAGGGGGKRGRRAQQRAAEQTPEQQVAALAAQVQELAAQLAGAPVYASLTAAMAAAAAAVPGQQQQQEQQPEGQQQQHLQQQHLQQQQWDWSGVQQLVVYGLGSPEDSRVSRHQLALVLLLRRLLPGLTAAPALYDPAFTPLDAQLLAALGLALIPLNEQGRRPAAAPTLFYLPHCEGVLCDNLLGANWCAERLGRLALLGNSFATYATRWAAPPGVRPATARPGRLLQLVHEGAVLELPVRDGGYHVASAFNDMSLHIFRPGAASFGDADAAADA